MHSGGGRVASLAARERGVRLPVRRLRPGVRVQIYGSEAQELDDGDLRALCAVVGHRDAVYCCCFDRTGARVFTGSDDMNVKIWCVQSGYLQHTCRGHTQAITEMAVSPCNNWLVSASLDGTARVWRIPSGAPEAVLAAHSGASVDSVVFAEWLDSPMMLSIGQDASILLWHAADWKRAPTVLHPGSASQIVLPGNVFDPTAAPAMAAALNPFVAAGGGAGSSGSALPSPSASCCAVNATGRLAAVGLSVAPYLLIWPIENGESSPSKQRSLIGHAEEVTTARFSNRGDVLLTGSRDGTARAWRWRGRITTFHQTKLVAPEGDTAHNSVLLNAHPSSKQHAVWVDTVAWSCDDRYVFTSESLRKRTADQLCVSSCVRVWSLPAANPFKQGGSAHLAVAAVTEGDVGRLLHTLQPANGASSSEAVYVLQPHPIEPHILASAGYDGRVRLWDVHDGSALYELRSPGIPRQGSEALLDACWSPDGASFVATSLDGEMLIFGLGADAGLAGAPPEQFFTADSAALTVDGEHNVFMAETMTPHHTLQRGLLVGLEGHVLSDEHQRPPSDLALPPPGLEHKKEALRKLANEEMSREEADSRADRATLSRASHAARSAMSSTLSNLPKRPSNGSPPRRVALINGSRVRSSSNQQRAAGGGSSSREGGRAAAAAAAEFLDNEVQISDGSAKSDDDDEWRDEAGSSSNDEHDEDSYVVADEVNEQVGGGRRRRRRVGAYTMDDDDEDESANESDLEESGRATRRSRRRRAGRNFDEGRRARERRDEGSQRPPRRQAAIDRPTYTVSDIEDEGDVDWRFRPKRTSGRRTRSGGAEEEEEEEEWAAGSAMEMETSWATALVGPLGWLLRSEARASEFVPQVGDRLIYLRRGHEQSLKIYPDHRSLPPPPFDVHPELPNAVACEVLAVHCMAPRPKDKTSALRLHVELRVCAAEAARPAAAEAASSSAADVGSNSSVPDGENWVVTVPPPEAGCTDFLVLGGRYEHALKQWHICRAGGTLAFRSAFLTDNGVFTWYNGHVLEVCGDPENLWEALLVTFEEGGTAGDPMSPWEVEVDGATPFSAPRLPEMLSVALVQSLSAVSLTEPAALLAQGAAAAGTSSSTAAGHAVVPVRLQLVLERLRNGFYRQWAAVRHDIDLIVAAQNGTALAPLARLLEPVLHAASSEEATSRGSWKQVLDESDSAGTLAEAMAAADPSLPPPPAHPHVTRHATGHVPASRPQEQEEEEERGRAEADGERKARRREAVIKDEEDAETKLAREIRADQAADREARAAARAAEPDGGGSSQSGGGSGYSGFKIRIPIPIDEEAAGDDDSDAEPDAKRPRSRRRG